MEITGWVLTGVGTVLAVGGLGVIAWEQILNNTCTPDPYTRECGTAHGTATLFVGGPLFLAGGVFAGAGLPLALVGRRRQTEPPPGRTGPAGQRGFPTTGATGWALTSFGAAAIIGGAVWTRTGSQRVEGAGPIIGAGAVLLGAGISLGVTGRRRAMDRQDGRHTERARTGWILTGIGGAALASGGVTILADSDKWGVKQAGRFVGGALVVSGGIMTAVGISLGVHGRRQRPAASTRRAPTISLSPTYFRHGAGLALHGRF